MLTSSPDRMRALAARCFLPLALVAWLMAAPRAALAQSSDTLHSEMDDLDRQLDGVDTDTVESNTELWEEYQRYRRDDDGLSRSTERVEIGGSITIREDELIEGDVVAVGGSVTVSGHVEGDVVAVGGSVILRDGAVIEGDAVAVGGKVRDEGGGDVHGERVSVDIGLNLGHWFHDWDGQEFSWGFPRWASISFDLVWLAVVLLLSFLLYAVAGNRIEVVSRRIDERPGESFLVGLLGACATPVAAIIATILLAITLIGLLLVPVVLLVLALMSVAGFVAASLTVGRRILAARSSADSLPASRGPYFQILIGFLALHALDLLSSLFDLGGPVMGPFSLLFGVLGVFVLIFASLLGYGALLSSRFGTSPGDAVAADAGVAPPPPPPPPPPPAESPAVEAEPDDAGEPRPEDHETPPSA